ncbi:hypothetical protein L207DRAFT_468992 [Hyaloscypha variabilis F]|uniref:Wax synthase domain-containing protein n=1 Tax=Hyaloscypha variabilis (strain UAMH 11265 / GT02V1 / F) TaxID=1149755 RepID=A0A2J6R547_HYAVF|nr:hypothetical protein L207DRAFT_468992 [Hyaloscypha variabilis F]
MFYFDGFSQSFNLTENNAPTAGHTSFTPSPQPLLYTGLITLCAILLGSALAFVPPSRFLLRGSVVATAFAIILQLQLSNIRISPNTYANSHLIVYIWPTLLRAIDLLLLKKIQITPILNSSSALSFYRPNTHTTSPLSRLWAATSLLLSARYIGTPWALPKIPPFSKTIPSYIPSRQSFLLRTSAIFIAAYLLCDTVNLPERSEKMTAAFPAENEKLFSRLSDVTAKEFVIRNVTTLWFAIVNVLYLTWIYSLLALVSVGSGMYPPAAWPPLFGSLSDASTLRGFWGLYWHKLMRGALEPMASFLSASILRLKRGTITSTYTHVFLVFFLSGLIHTSVDLEFGIPFLSSPAPRFFIMQALGIMFEEAVERAWRSYAPVSPFEFGPNGYEKRRRWAKIVGYCWVWAFFVWTVPSFSWETLRIAGPRTEHSMPWSFVEWSGLKGSVSLDFM